MKIKNKISLPTAILININIILGAGLFINPRPLTQIAGSLGFLGYFLSALILLPIVLSIAELAKINPNAGGLYVFSKKYINPFAGFISGWSYFLGKTTSAALLAHVFVTFFQRRIPYLQTLPTLLLDCSLILLLILLNIIGLRLGGKIQYFFISMKIIPIAFVVFAGSLFFTFEYFSPQFSDFTDLLPTLPVAIFVLLSFEMICSIGHLIDKPEKNLKRAVLFSFFIVATIAAVFQFIIFGALGDALKQIAEPVLGLGTVVFLNNPMFARIINAFVFASIIGGSFGSLTANCWNLFALAKDNHLPASKLLTKVSKTQVPYLALCFEGLLACLILAISKQQVHLQNMTVLGLAIAYLFSSFSATFAQKENSNFKIQKYIPKLAILSSLYIIFICVRNLFISGISLPILFIFLAGLIAAVWEKYKKKKLYQAT